MSIAHEWGSTPADRAIDFPCDRHLPDAEDTLYRAVDVNAHSAVVFRWLCQLRVAPYSYDWLDNWGRESPRTLTPGLDQLAVGQRVMVFDRRQAVGARAVVAEDLRDETVHDLTGDGHGAVAVGCAVAALIALRAIAAAAARDRTACRGVRLRDARTRRGAVWGDAIGGDGLPVRDLRVAADDAGGDGGAEVVRRRAERSLARLLGARERRRVTREHTRPRQEEHEEQWSHAGEPVTRRRPTRAFVRPESRAKAPPHAYRRDRSPVPRRAHRHARR